MDYEKKYRDLVEAVKKLQEANPSDEGIQKWVEDNVPELAESDDEKIRKEIIAILQYKYEKYPKDPKYCNAPQWLAWLEKQGEQKHTDKVEQKFHEGDWIIHRGTENIYQVVAVIDNQYQLKYGDNYTVQKCADVDRCARLWDITKDEKDGDVLCYKDEISLYKHDIKNCTKQETTFGGFVYHCCYDGKRFIIDSLYSLTEQDKMDIHPATKEQRDALFLKMKEAGYEWDAEKKELKKIKIE